MTELEKFQKVNKCETVEELANVVLSFADEHEMIQGRKRLFDANKMAFAVRLVVSGDVIPNALTREFGIRQQALYIKYYNPF